jgi:hypothetical protein
MSHTVEVALPTTSRIALIWIALGLTICGASALAQTGTCPPPPTLFSATVNANVTFNPTTNLYTYTYTISNAASSQQAIQDFLVDFASPISNVSDPTGWTNEIVSGRSTEYWDATLAGALPAGEPDVGQIPPGLDEIKPGSSLGGFSFQSPNPPGPVNYYLHGYIDYVAFFGANSGANTYKGVETQQENLIADCPQSYGGFFDLAVKGNTQGPVTFIPVQIEIKRGSATSTAPINVMAQGEIPVTVLSSSSFDVTTIDPSTARFGPGIATPLNGTAHQEDVNGDGATDMVFHFDSGAAAIPCGATSATLMATTLSGTTVQGSDSVVTVPCNTH